MTAVPFDPTDAGGPLVAELDAGARTIETLAAAARTELANADAELRRLRAHTANDGFSVGIASGAKGFAHSVLRTLGAVP